MGGFGDRRLLGRSGLEVGRVGLGSSYGLGADDVERAFDRGVDWLYWGTARTRAFGEGIRRVTRKDRDRAVVVVQSYTRAAALLGPSLTSALRALRLDHVDVLLLGWWNEPPPERILEAAAREKERGRARHVMVSCHKRQTFRRYVDDPRYAAIMVRYNAAHPGAEREVFPDLAERPAEERPSVVAYTATRWGNLLDRTLLPVNERAPRGADCYRFVLTSPHVDLVLAGPANGAELDEALSALERGPMDDEELAWMKRVGAHVRAHAPRGGSALVRALDRWFM